MTVNRFVFELGDGIDTITGAHKGRGIIDFKDEECETESKKNQLIMQQSAAKEVKSKKYQRSKVPKNMIKSGDTQYDVSIVGDYTELYQALDLKASMNASAGPSNLTLESTIFKKARLSKQSVSILIKGKMIDDVNIMPSDVIISKEHKETLKKRRGTFVLANGDEYISQVMYGKKIYALINFVNTSKEEALHIKQALEAKLSESSAPAAGATARVGVDNNSQVKKTLTDISIEYSGVNLGLPSVATNIEGLFSFIDKFNKAPISGSPIAYVAEPYVTIIQNREAAELANQISMVQSLLANYDEVYNKIRLVIPSIEKILVGARYFQLLGKDAKKNIFELEEYFTYATYYKKIIEDIMAEIIFSKTDLTNMPAKISKRIILDIPKLDEKKYSDDDQQSSDFHKRQFKVKNQLVTIINKCASKIREIEANVDMLSRQIIAEVVSVTQDDDHFQINLPPSGAVIRWDILVKENDPSGGIKSFDLLLKNQGKFFSSNTLLHKRISSSMETKLNVTPKQKLIIRPTESSGNYIIIGSVVGLQALDADLPRHATEWITRDWFIAKRPEPKKFAGILEFDGRSAYYKLCEPWLSSSIENMQNPEPRGQVKLTLLSGADDSDNDLLIEPSLSRSHSKFFHKEVEKKEAKTEAEPLPQPMKM